MKRILIIGLSMFILGGCIQSTNIIGTNYDFPVNGDEISQILKEEELPWNLGDEILVNASENIYLIENEIGKNTVKLHSSKDGEAQFVRLDLLNPEDDNTLDIERLDGERIPNMFTMAARAYGEDSLSQAEKVYKDVIDYMKNRSAKEYGPSIFESKYGESYFSVGMNIREDNYSLAYIRIDNKISYENLISEYAEKWSKSLDSKLIIKSESTIKELRDTETEEVMIIRGSIKKQSRLPEEKAKLLNSIDEKGNKKLISKHDYIDAVLVNGDEEISIILKINGLSEEEIKEERNHYIYYSPENTVGVVEYSIE